MVTDTIFHLQTLDVAQDSRLASGVARAESWTPTTGLCEVRDVSFGPKGLRYLAQDLQDFPTWKDLSGRPKREMFSAALDLGLLLFRLHQSQRFHFTLTPRTVHFSPDGPILSEYFWAVVSKTEVLPPDYPEHARRWAAPEAIAGRPEKASDVFSLAWLMIDSLGGNSVETSALQALGLSKKAVEVLQSMTDAESVVRPSLAQCCSWIRSLITADPLDCCRVCGLVQETPPWGIDGQVPNYGICACCGAEFGVDDHRFTEVISRRRQWLSSGTPWFQESARPLFWKKEHQLENIPDEWTLKGVE